MASYWRSLTALCPITDSDVYMLTGAAGTNIGVWDKSNGPLNFDGTRLLCEIKHCSELEQTNN